MSSKDNTEKKAKASISITGMTCTTCAATIEKGLSDTPGVEQANVNFASEKVSIEYDPAMVDLTRERNTTFVLSAARKLSTRTPKNI